MSTKRAIGIGIAVLLAAVALGWGIWALNVATSGVRGQGNAVIQKNSAANWTTAQAEFEDMYAHIVATDKKVSIAKERLDLDAEDRTAQDVYYGTQTVCQSAVADYNAKARTFLAEDFRSADLPAQIDGHDPMTDCKEN